MRTFLVALVAIAFSVTLLGCGGRPAAAQKLFDKGEYQQVIDKYPELEIARRARAKVADGLLEKKDYQTVLSQYADTPAAFKAKNEMAQDLFNRGQYKMVLDSFPHSPLATMAKERLADSLFAAGQIDSLVRLYPDTPKGKQIKEEQATIALAKVKKMRGAAQKTALEELVTKYAGTEAYKDASQMLNKIREAEAQKKK